MNLLCCLLLPVFCAQPMQTPVFGGVFTPVSVACYQLSPYCLANIISSLDAMSSLGPLSLVPYLCIAQGLSTLNDQILHSHTCISGN